MGLAQGWWSLNPSWAKTEVPPGPSSCPSVAAAIPGACGPVLAHKVGGGRGDNQIVHVGKQSPLRILVTQLPPQR